MFVYHYKKLIHLIVVLGVLSYSHFSHTSITVERADDGTKNSTIQSAPDNVSEAKGEVAQEEIKTNVNEVKAGAQAQKLTTDNVSKAEVEAQAEIKTNVETNDTFKMPNHRFEFTGLFGFVHISNTRTPLKWNLSGDILYRIMKYDRWMSSIGLRYRTFFSHPGSGNDFSNSIYAGEFSVHQLTWLSQTLIFFEDIWKIRGFFGPVFGINIWRYLRIDYEDDSYITSSEFLISWLSVQFGVKTGIMLSSHFAFTTEIGFDVLGFRKYKEIDDKVKAQGIYLPLNNMYITLGISYFL